MSLKCRDCRFHVEEASLHFCAFYPQWEGMDNPDEHWCGQYKEKDEVAKKRVYEAQKKQEAAQKAARIEEELKKELIKIQLKQGGKCIKEN